MSHGKGKGKTKHGEKGETAAMEAREHSPKFLKRAAKQAERKRGGK